MGITRDAHRSLPPQHALVAETAREAVGVEALEEELGRLASGAEQVAEACERDRAGAVALLEEQALRYRKT